MEQNEERKCVCACVRVCACLREKERERERDCVNLTEHRGVLTSFSVANKKRRKSAWKVWKIHDKRGSTSVKVIHVNAGRYPGEIMIILYFIEKCEK